MNIFMAILRIIHIFGGIFWVGVVWYNVLFLLPRVKSFGQDQGRIMQTLAAPPFPQYMTAAGLATVLSGILMYWNASAGFNPAWIATLPGAVLTGAGLLGILLVIEGLFRQRPIGMRMAELGRQAAAAGGPPNPAMMQEMQMLSARLESATYRGAYVLALIVIGMATFRYL